MQPPQHYLTGASFSLSSQPPTSHTCENIADIAARVVNELNLSHHHPYHHDHDQFKLYDHLYDHYHHDDHDHHDGSDEFEFAVIMNSSPISADEIFSNGQIKPMFLHNQQPSKIPLNWNREKTESTQPYPYPLKNQDDDASKTLRLPLRKLLENREDQTGGSCSSSEADELEGVPPETYCLWTPNKKEEVLKMRKKSKSTGYPSKRWRFKDLMHRSNSDGKDTFVFLDSKAVGDGKRREKTVGIDKVNGNGNDNGNCSGKKKSYLPYRQNLVGFFANVNGISRTVRPF